MKPLPDTRAEQIAASTAALVLACVGFLPQFGGPGYESALAGGLVLPTAAALGTALGSLSSFRDADRDPEKRAATTAARTPFDVLGRGVAFGAVLAVVGTLLATLHGLRVGFCDAPLGYELWATGPGPGAVMGGAWGAFAGLVASRTRWPRFGAVALSLLGPLGGIAIGFWRFYSSPMVFGFDPFVGYFAGPLYDTIVDPGTRLLSYRIGSLCSLLAASVLAWHLEGGGAERLRFAWRARPGVVTAGVLALSLSVAITLSGAKLGHFSTTQSIEAGLGRTLSVGRCQVVYSSGVTRPDAARVARECTGHLPEIEAYLGARGPEHVKVFLFASDAEKGAYMGASHTYIAKPWRGEVYVQAAGFPHPTLGHELAHVVSGSFGRGPFRVAGPLLGIVPDPGRIEGVAVAASPGEDDDFTLAEWSKALLELNLLPSMDSVFRLGFLGKSASAAYTVAGAFVSFFHDHYGAGALRSWYGGTSIEAASGGKSLAVLDAEFRASLQALQLRPQLLAMAKARFDRPSIFGRVCPRRIDRDLGVAESRLGSGDIRGAREAFQSLLDLEPLNTRAKLGVALCEVRDDHLALALERYQALAKDPRLSVLERAAAFEASGDVAVMDKDPLKATQAYAAVAELDADEDRQRTLEVKELAALAPPGSSLQVLLIGDPKTGPSWDEAAALLGAEASHGSPLAQYLLGRNLWQHGRAEAALRYLDQALEPLPEPSRSAEYDWPPPQRIVREALRLRIVISCSEPSLNRPSAKDDLKQLEADPGVSAAKRDAVVRLAKRCGF